MTVHQSICLVAQCDRCKRQSRTYTTDKNLFIESLKHSGWSKEAAGSAGWIFCPECSKYYDTSNRGKLIDSYSRAESNIDKIIQILNGISYDMIKCVEGSVKTKYDDLTDDCFILRQSTIDSINDEIRDLNKLLGQIRATKKQIDV